MQWNWRKTVRNWLLEGRLRRAGAKRRPLPRPTPAWTTRWVQALEDRSLLSAAFPSVLSDGASVSPAWFATVSSGTDAAGWDTSSGEGSSWIVQFAPAFALEVGGPAALSQQVHAPFGHQVVQGLGAVGLVEMRFAGDEAAVSEWLAQQPEVAQFSRNAVVTAAGIPNDAYWTDQWNLHNTGQSGGTAGGDIDAVAAWDRTTGSAEVVVAVLDSGIDITHPDLANNIWTNPGEIPGNNLDDDSNGFIDDYYGWDFASDDATPFGDDRDGNGDLLPKAWHGTVVAGILGAEGNNSIGGAGVAWDVSLMSVQVLRGGTGDIADVIAGFNYVTMMKTRAIAPVNVRAINASLAGPVFDATFETAVANAGGAEILVVAAAGNELADNDAVPSYPANFDLDCVVSVAATTRTDVLWDMGNAVDGSNYGALTVDLAAPGAEILGPMLGDYYLVSGTSMAAPHVAGTAALAFSLFPHATVHEVKAALLDGVDKVPALQGKVATGGRLNASQTLAQLQSSELRLVRDINALPGSSNPEQLTEMNGVVYFVADGRGYGSELWRSDGTSAGTWLVRDINPGSTGSGPGNLTNVNGTLFFSANNGTNGSELWKTDGTETGTVLVKDIWTGSSGSFAGQFAAIGNWLLFSATDGIKGAELWKSDGTSGGTVLVKDIRPTGASYPSSLTNVNGTLYFSANDGTNGYELWRTDGTSTGTFLVRDIRGGSQAGSPQVLINVNGTLFFRASDGVTGNELWKSDGTSGGTVLVKDLRTGVDPSDPRDLVDVGGTLFFSANDGSTGRELWKSDGTSSGTVLVRDIRGGVNFSGVSDFGGQLININGTLFFRATDGTTGHELWKSDGTSTGTSLVRRIRSGSTVADPADFTNVGGTLYFRANDGSTGYELWKSDGTSTGTVLIKDIRNGLPNAYPKRLTNVNGTLFFQATDETSGTELWTSNGTSSGTTQVLDLTGTSASVPESPVNVNETLFFVANDGLTGNELWKSDGTSSGTSLVRDISSGVSGSSPAGLINVDGILYFTATTGSSGMELWKSDGTSAGTVLVADIRAGSVGSNPSNLVDVNGTLFFYANDGSTGRELWKTDGTAAGTVLVKDIRSGSAEGSPQQLINLNGTLYFQANDGSTGFELWKSDGTSSGTQLVKDIQSGVNSSNPFSLTVVNGVVFFKAQDGVAGYELWKTDGTSSGTSLVLDIRSGSSGCFPRYLENVNGTLFFAALTNSAGYELWKSDGTSTGTSMVREIRSGSGGAFRSGSSGLAQTRNLTNVAGTLFFAANNGTTGYELWKSDGTSTGTVLVKDIWPGANGTIGPRYLTNVNGVLYFQVNDGVHGTELWRSDGTSSGTTLVADLVPGLRESKPRNSVSTGSQLFVTATTPDFGEELWVLPLNRAPSELLLAPSSLAENLPADTTVGTFTTTDPDTGNIFTYSLVTGTGDTDNAAFSISGDSLKTAASFDFETKSSYSIRVRTADPGELFYETVFTVTVSDVMELEAGANRTVGEGDLLSLASAAYNAPVPTSQLSPTIDWGDGTSEPGVLVPVSGTNGGTLSNTHRYSDNGTFTVTLSLTDGTTTLSDSFVTTVTNAAPVGGTIAGLAAAVRGQTLSYSLTFTDAGLLDTHTASINWGDGTSSTGIVNQAPGSGTVSGSHIYTASGNYTITITVTDDDTGTATSTKAVSIVAANLQTSELDPTKTDLYVGGTTGNDTIALALSGTNTTVTINAISAGSFAPTGRILVFGQAGNDNVTIASTITRNAWLYGDDGNDTLTGGGGNDVLIGGAGTDSQVGGAGNDTYLFDADSPLGIDTLSDSAGVDTLDFSATTGQAIALNLGLISAQMVNANLTLTLTSASAFENLIGGGLNDTLTGNTLANTLVGGPGNDTLTGGAGNDVYLFDLDELLGADTLNESGGGLDTLDFSPTTGVGATVDLAVASVQTIAAGRLTLVLGSATTFENVTGGSGDDILLGNSLTNILRGGPGNDQVAGRSNNDLYVFEPVTVAETDTLTELTGEGLDRLDFSLLPATDAVTIDLGTAGTTLGSHTNRTLLLAAAGQGAFWENVTGGAGNDSVQGNVAANLLQGGAGNDTLAGGDGDDTLEGGAGNDSLAGDLNNDTYLFDVDSPLGTDTLTESGAGTDTLDFAATTTVALVVDLAVATTQVVHSNLSLNLGAGDLFENVTGGSKNDTLLGNSLVNVLRGGPGNDNLAGRTNNDLYVFEPVTVAETDTLTELSGEGLDRLDFSLLTATTTPVTLDLSSATTTLGSHANRTILVGAAGQAAWFENATGGAGNDSFTGNAAANLLQGGAGNDTLLGGDGNDTLEGGAGDDSLVGGLNNDMYLFDADLVLGTDTLTETGLGTETLNFSPTTTKTITVNLGLITLQTVVASNLVILLSAADAFENVTGGSLGDTLTGNAVANVLVGNDGNDTLAGLGGSDTLNGGLGNDTYVFNTGTTLGTDTLNESAGGLDTLDFSTSTTLGITVNLGVATTQVVNANLSLILSADNTFENATGGALADVLIGNDLANTLTGNAGNDTLTGGAGNDSLTGGLGDDTYLFAANSALGTDTLNESAGGTDTLDFSGTTTLGVTVNLTTTTSQVVNANLSLVLGLATAFENATGGGGNDILTGNTLANVLTGGAGNDTLIGLAGNDTLAGGLGDDRYPFTATAALGTDSLIEAVGEGLDLLDFGATTVAVTVNLGLSTTQVVNANLSLTLNAVDTFEMLIGSSVNDTLTGNSLANVIFGGAGNDTIVGLAGRDLLFGGNGNDNLNGGDDEDIVIGGLTTYYSESTKVLDRTAIAAIWNEWTRTDLGYTSRITNLKNGGGLNGTFRLSTLTVLTDSTTMLDTLVGGLALDWFWQFTGDSISDLKTGGTETVN